MALFQNKVKSNIKDQIKGIFTRNPIPRKESVISKVSEDISQVNPFELKVDNNSGRRCGDRVQNLPSKRGPGFDQSKRNYYRTYVKQAPEFGDSKVNSHPHKYKCSSKYCSTVDTECQDGSTTSHLDRNSHSNINQPMCRYRTRSIKKHSQSARKMSESRKPNSVADKSTEKSKFNNNKSRLYNDEYVKKASFPNQSRSLPQSTFQQYNKRNAHHSTRKNENSGRNPKGANFYGSRHQTWRNEYQNETINKNKTQYWSSTSFSSDFSKQFRKRRNAGDNHKGNSKSRTWMFKPKSKNSFSPMENVNPQYNYRPVENGIDNRQPFRFSSKFPNRHHESKRDDSSRTIGNSTSTVVEAKGNTGTKSGRTKPFMKYVQGCNKNLLTNTLCPQRRHEVSASNKPCVCMEIENLKSHQTGPVIYEWHKVETKAVDGKGVNNLECSPSLDEFKIMSPAKVSTGGQGTVIRVHVPSTTMRYALKFKFRRAKSDKTWNIERREAKLLQKVKHAFIVETYHIYETDSAIFMAFEYLSGGCLWHHIARIGVLPEGYAIYYAACILTALSYLHEKGIVYRDMKAENIVLDFKHCPKLIDFGMAKYFPSVKREMRLDVSGKNNQPSEPPVGKEFMHKLGSFWTSPDIDSEDEVDDPPTKYYYAAYLAPEIYETPTESNQFIDSWGLGYLTLEMVLGYGIFRPIPWANVKGHHLTQEWRLYLPPDLLKKLTPKCRSFIFKTLVRQPQARLSLNEAMQHAFFWRVPWTILHTFPGPNLSKFQNPMEFHRHHSKNLFDNFDHRPKFFAAKKVLNPHPIYNMIHKPKMQSRRDSNEFTSHQINTGKGIDEGVATDKVGNSRNVDDPRNNRVYDPVKRV